MGQAGGVILSGNGYIKLYRALLAHPVFTNEKMLKVWIWCLLKATHAPYDQVVGRRTVHLEPSQFITGRKAAAAELRMKESTVWDYLRLLQCHKMVTLFSDNKYSVVTVENWASYQNTETDSDSKSTSNQHQINTNNNSKNNRSVNSASKAFNKPTVDEVRSYCAERNNGIDAEHFINHYEANGWMVGRNKMKNWKAAIVTWEKRSNGQQEVKPKTYVN